MALVFLTGGARSGKSHTAVRLAGETGRDVVFVATAIAEDDDMRARIDRHRADRPAGWDVVEEPRDLAGALLAIPDESCAVVDCLTLWVSNLMAEGQEDRAIEVVAEDSAGVALARTGPTIVVSNEVGSGVHPPTELGRRFADLLGRVNSTWSYAADEAYLCVAGRMLRLD